MALQKEIWIQDIQENLFPPSSFLLRSVDDSGYISYKTVHVPQAGSNPSVLVNNASLPVTPVQRTDADWTYNIDQYAATPFLITDLEAAQISYDKRKSISGQFIETLTQTVGDYTLNKWALASPVFTGASANAVKTSGTPADGSALAPGATGTRNTIGINDLGSLNALLDNQNVPREGRILLMNPFMYAQLFKVSGFISAQAFGKATLPEGIIDRAFGFDIMVRSGSIVYDTSYALKAVGASGATTDNLAAIAWHPSFVSRALGNIDIFADFGDNGYGKPEYYGGLLSSRVWFGAKQRRSDLKGVAMLIQQ